MKQLTVVAAALLILTACGKKDPVPPVPSSPAGGSSGGARPEKLANGEPGVITVKHVLIAFKDSGTNATRSKDEAQKLAYEVLNRAKSGEDFDKLMKELSDDSPTGGVYKMVNNGVAKEGEEYERTGMVPAFGDVGFRLKVGEIGVAEHDPTKSPYGWHIIKRLQ
jgi:hypothetical protein